MRQNQILPGSPRTLDAEPRPKPELTWFRPAASAVIMLATAQAAIVMGFGTWATMTVNPALLERQTALAGIVFARCSPVWQRPSR